MSDTLYVKVADGHYDLCSIELYDILREPFLTLEHLIEFTSFHEWHYEVEAELRLEQIVHSDQKRVVAGEQYVFLKLGIVNLIVLKEDVLPD